MELLWYRKGKNTTDEKLGKIKRMVSDQGKEEAHLYMSPAGRLVVFDLWGLGSPARLMSESEEIHSRLNTNRRNKMMR